MQEKLQDMEGKLALVQKVRLAVLVHNVVLMLVQKVLPGPSMDTWPFGNTGSSVEIGPIVDMM